MKKKKEFDVREWAMEARKARSKALMMPYDQKLALLKKKEWINKGHWDNWFHPVSGWNYSMRRAVEYILRYDD